MEHHQQLLETMLNRLYSGEATEQEKMIIRQWMLTLNMPDPSLQGEELNLAKLEMLHRILIAEEAPMPEIRTHVPVVRLLYRIAAAAVVFLVVFSWWWLQRRGSEAGKRLVYTTISATGRQIAHITLPDGSEVWLNTHSKLEYDEGQFNKKERHVRLTGEGYFEISRDSLRPFIVSSENIDTRVLGTGFNIETYPGESEIRVALVHGSVAVEDQQTHGRILLHPNEMLRYSKAEQKWGVAAFSATTIRNWINGYLSFDELPLADVLERVADKYRISIKYDQEQIKNKRVTGDFKSGQWQTVLDNILFIHRLHYHERNGIIYINQL
ncbi:FecR family protein [Chitinophaga sp. 30R24]|uniref:FecR family protein n=1 Tax=Chitinophaga sp. 30R24 TaxID=3248838 RepID=UPI003B90CD9B